MPICRGFTHRGHVQKCIYRVQTISSDRSQDIQADASCACTPFILKYDFSLCLSSRIDDKGSTAILGKEVHRFQFYNIAFMCSNYRLYSTSVESIKICFHDPRS